MGRCGITSVRAPLRYKPALHFTKYSSQLRHKVVHSFTRLVVKAAKCYLVGSGPGSIEYMTIKSIELLRNTECVIFDDLACQESLAECQPNTQLVNVGKRGSKPSPKQAEICSILVEMCQKHSHVVRLKGGCVSVFSRVNEEISALREHGIPYELIPGVSSALAAPVLAGIPLTDKILGRSTAVISAHDPSAIDWLALRQAVDTVVMLMSGKTLFKVLADASLAGWPPHTPVAVIKYAGSDKQQQWISSVQDARQDIGEGNLSPCVVVVGDVCTTANIPNV